VRKDSEMRIICRQCGSEFVFTKAEQEFYEQQGFTFPRRCKECRSEKRSEPHHLVCSQCGSELQKEAPVYCTTCLENVQLEFDIKTKKIQSAANEAFAKLKANQSEKSELEESLRHKEQILRNLEESVTALSRDSEEMHHLYETLNKWFQPTLNGIEARIEERLKALEDGQDRINKRMLQMVEKMHELFDNITLLELVKRSLKGYHKQSPQSA